MTTAWEAAYLVAAACVPVAQQCSESVDAEEAVYLVAAACVLSVVAGVLFETLMSLRAGMKKQRRDMAELPE